MLRTCGEITLGSRHWSFEFHDTYIIVPKVKLKIVRNDSWCLCRGDLFLWWCYGSVKGRGLCGAVIMEQFIHLLNPLLRYSSHTIKSIHFKWTIQWLLQYLQSCATTAQSNFRTFPSVNNHYFLLPYQALGNQQSTFSLTDLPFLNIWNYFFKCSHLYLLWLSVSSSVHPRCYIYQYFIPFCGHIVSNCMCALDQYSPVCVSIHQFLDIWIVSKF